MAKMLDMLDDAVNSYITANMVDNNKMKLSNDKIGFFESLTLKDKNVETDDKNNSKITISSEDAKKLLNDMAQQAGAANIHELMQK